MGNTNWDKLISGEEIKKVKKIRSVPYMTKTIFASSLEDEKSEGWDVLSHMKDQKKLKVKKDKPQDEIFEDTIWGLLANLGFTTMNRDRHFTMSYGDSDAQTQQIDVFAVDNETILFVECKSAISLTNSNFKNMIEAYGEKMRGLQAEANKKFPNRKCKFIFATNNYILSNSDEDRLKAFNFVHFNENTVTYYQKLVKHLGTSARYQLLGNLFAQTTIKGMENRIPAIRGKMGGHTYYSFSIEPEKLLKIGYVLHRSEANSNLMPTYQRLIKKGRLKAVRKFINEDHGYFPNSIIISIDTKRSLQFDRSEKQIPGAVADLGILHLPRQYRSAYIIDGQHRLYGYSDSQYASSNSIPVVAFENLDKKEQVRLFMEINENQKSVSKKLRNILNADILWDSTKESERRDALRLKIAQDLGEKTTSPLYGRINIDEDQGSEIKCVTIECIRIAINVGNFLSRFDKRNILTQNGIFDLGQNDATLKLLYGFLEKCLSYVKTYSAEEWEKGSAMNGILTINNGIGGLIRTINDIANFLIDNKKIDPMSDSIDHMAAEAEYYLDPICRFINQLSEETRTDIKKSYGGNGPILCWRYFQKAIHDDRPEFNPSGMIKYWEDHGKEFNSDAIRMLPTIEKAVKALVREKLEESYDSKWIKEIPQPIYTDANARASKEEYETGETQDWWDYITLLGVKSIVTYGKNWSNIFSDIFTLNSKTMGDKEVKTEWLTVLYKLQSKAAKANFTVAKVEYQLLCEAYAKFAESET
ncbi:MAG TPA: DGQHR domain-containing protein [Candidatus Ornithoclostridium excrementipullorum]|nr:DGQHR domain-containing protein [Candidatus Ornithoclostridium excrementipullorum]